MNARLKTADANSSDSRRSPWNTHIGVITILTAAIAVCVAVLFALYSKDNSGYRPLPPTAHSQYPIGIKDKAEPSGESPPAANALPHYKLTYVNDFVGSSLPPGWNVYSGVPGGVAGGQFGIAHVAVSGGLLHLNTWKDPRYQDRWVTGGLCQCEVARTYGAYFVRSRVTAPGPNEVELLWPATNKWPPEIDFNETGGKVDASSSTIHFSAINSIDQRLVQINMEKWHTWGVIWTPTSVSYVVDGQVWGVITSAYEIADVPMTLDLQQTAACVPGRVCTIQRASMLVDWVVEYSAT
jgi:hypothetical protein